MKFFKLLCMVLALVSCNDLTGFLGVQEDFSIKGQEFTQGEYPLSVKFKGKKVIFEADQKTVKIKLKRKIDRAGRFKITSQEMGEPLELEGNIEVYRGQSSERRTVEICDVIIPQRRCQVVCPDRRERRNCRRVCNWVNVRRSGRRDATYRYWQEETSVKADLLSLVDLDAPIAYLDGSRTDQRSELIHAGRCYLY